uniref:nickel-binding protein n=1 Tax=uncultured Rhizobium sp. TaxID=155567 RepID=UPI00263276B9|nr:nickel-binding protein [uncultured Rhizobium sp.]
MPRFIVERTVVGADRLGSQALADIAQSSRQALSGMDVPYRGGEVYARGDTVCCLHVAENAEVLRRRLEEGGFPADRVVPAVTCDDIASGVLCQLRTERGLRPRVHFKS